MSPTAEDQVLAERLEELESRLARVEATLIPLPHRRSPSPAVAAPSVPPPVPSRVQPPTAAGAPRESSVRRLTEQALSDLVGGRVLAWLGGIATLLGVVLFLALAISRGWMGTEARVVLSGAAASLLMATGIWLHARRGRTEASVVMVGAAAAGMVATLLVASEDYELIAPQLAVVGSMLVGALATNLAVRWAGRAIGAIGLLGALLSPVLVGAPADAGVIALLAVAAACAVWTTIAQRWGWLALASIVICTPQWGIWILAGRPVIVDVAVLVWFGMLGLAGAVGLQAASGRQRLVPSAAALLALSTCVVAVLGAVALGDAAGAGYGKLWLAGLAVVHVAGGVWNPRRLVLTAAFRRLLIAAGVILGDVSFGLSAGGLALAAGWGAMAIAFAWLSRRAAAHEGDELLAGLGVGAHIALALVRVLIVAPPSGLGAQAQLLPLLSGATLAASCLTSAHLIDARRLAWAHALNVLGLAAIAYLAAEALAGSALVIAWALESVALSQLGRRTGEPLPRYGALGFLALAAIHAVIVEAPPAALLTGAASLGNAAVALGAVCVGTLVAGYAQPAHGQPRRWLVGTAAVALLYLVSIAIISAFQPAAGTADLTLLDLSVRQQGQVLLSACWSLIGLIGLIAGLRRHHAAIRNAGLALLLLAVAKVFLYDLSTLTSIYRVISFIALGLLLLAGAFAYQRLRPPPAPDLRAVHASQR